jgi:hypothetical protein
MVAAEAAADPGVEPVAVKQPVGHHGGGKHSAEMFDQLRQGGARVAQVGAAAGEDRRPLGLAEQLSDRRHVDLGYVRARPVRTVAHWWVDMVGAVGIDGEVRGKADQDRAALAFGLCHRLPDERGDVGGSLPARIPRACGGSDLGLADGLVGQAIAEG